MGDLAEGLLAGFLGGVQGGAKSAADSIQSQQDQEAKVSLQQQFLDMQAEKELAVAEAKRASERKQLSDDAKVIDDKAQSKLASDAMAGIGDVGVGAKLSAEDVQALRDNPEALASYRNSGANGLLNYSREEELSAEIDASKGVNRELGKEARAELGDIYAAKRASLEERKTAVAEKKADAMAAKLAGGGSGSAESNGGVEGWQYRQWKQENPSGSYTKFKEWMSDSKYNKEKAAMEMATKLLSGNPYPSDDEVQAAMNTADKLVNKTHSSNANGAQKGGKTERPPLGTFFR